jgi:hypothetical protein
MTQLADGAGAWQRGHVGGNARPGAQADEGQFAADDEAVDGASVIVQGRGNSGAGRASAHGRAPCGHSRVERSVARDIRVR